MKRIAVLGNSHVACLKQGWDRVRSNYVDTRLDWFAAKKNGMRDLRVEGNCLVPASDDLRQDLEFTSGGKSRVECESFDGFIVVGSNFAMPHIRKDLSAAVRLATCSDIFLCSMSCWLVSAIRKICPNAIVAVVHNPLKASVEEPGLYATHFLSYENTFPLVADIVQQQGGQLFAQPSETMCRSWSTQRQFSVGSVALGSGAKRWFPHSAEEDAHMNADYGEIVVNALLARFSGLAAD